MLSQMMGPSFVYKTFHDVGLNNIPDELQSLAQKAYRAAFKVALGRHMNIFKVLNFTLINEFYKKHKKYFTIRQTEKKPMK